MLARICGRDKRVPDVIKLPGEEQLAASLSKLFYKEEESIGQRQPTEFSVLFFLPCIAVTLGYAENLQTDELATKFVFPLGRNLRIYLLPDSEHLGKITPLQNDTRITQRFAILGISSVFKKHRLN